MLPNNSLKRFQCSILVTAIFMGYSSLTHAFDERVDDKPADTKVESGEPQQQATPAQPSVEPLDADADTCLV